jgi:hypothetical protein
MARSASTSDSDLKKYGLSFLVLMIALAVIWQQGIGRHSIAFVVASDGQQTPAPIFLVSLRAFYQDGNREAQQILFDDVVATNTRTVVQVPPRDTAAFKRLELTVLHPGFRYHQAEYLDNPHWFHASIGEVTPLPWTIPKSYEPLPFDVLEMHFSLSRNAWVSALGEEVAGYQLWPYRDVLQTLLPRASLVNSSLGAIGDEERARRVGQMRQDHRYLIRLVRKPGTARFQSE